MADFVHDAATYSGADIKWFQQFGGSDVALQFAGGEHAWDLITKFDQAIATGLYLFSVKDSDSGDTQTGKILDYQIMHRSLCLTVLPECNYSRRR